MVAFAVPAGHGIPIKSVRPSPVIINLTDRPLHSSGGVLLLRRTLVRCSCSPLVCTLTHTHTHTHKGCMVRRRVERIQQRLLPPPPVGNNTLIYIVPPTDLEAPVPNPDLYGVNFSYSTPAGVDSSRPSALFVWTSSRPLHRDCTCGSGYLRYRGIPRE